MKPSKKIHRVRPDVEFIAQFRRHIALSTSCQCTIDGADKRCDLGFALHAVAYPKPVVEHTG